MMRAGSGASRKVCSNNAASFRQSHQILVKCSSPKPGTSQPNQRPFSEWVKTIGWRDGSGFSCVVLLLLHCKPNQTKLNQGKKWRALYDDVPASKRARMDAGWSRWPVIASNYMLSSRFSLFSSDAFICSIIITVCGTSCFSSTSFFLLFSPLFATVSARRNWYEMVCKKKQKSEGYNNVPNVFLLLVKHLWKIFTVTHMRFFSFILNWF